eukprot:TRINITY_DN4324_c0_g1_i1.p1 TRINITY_DN4324_c0_g1~~TRINITY_DN4324_c0_g1_i1.p1  ORF type:complete len:235 (-),score=78.85 TRINITY_DN4324_c0_g1_i1:171-851(-)
MKVNTKSTTVLLVVAVVVALCATTTMAHPFRSRLMDHFFQPLSFPNFETQRWHSSNVQDSAHSSEQVPPTHQAQLSYKYLPELEQTVVLVELPGVKRQDVVVSVGDDRVVTVEASTSYCDEEEPVVDATPEKEDVFVLEEDDDDIVATTTESETSDEAKERTPECPLKSLEKHYVSQFKLRSVDANTIEKMWSELDNGVLFIYIPKAEPLSRKIPVLEGGFVNLVE